MNKKNITPYLIIAIAIILLLAVMVPKHINGNFTSCSGETCNLNLEVEKLEIIHFHGTNQCWSCVTMGDMAEETINAYFLDELNSGKITFEHLNVDLSENRDLVKKYGVTGSSLWIGSYYEDGTFSKEENINVWYKIKDKEAYMSYLKSVIESKLAGE